MNGPSDDDSTGVLMKQAARPTVPDAELTVDDGQVAHWHDEPFTGTATETAGGYRSECAYVGGMLEGTSRDFGADGTLRAETTFRENLRHGAEREYDAQGRLVVERRYEYNVLVSERTYDDAGQVRSTYAIDPTTSTYRHLARRRDSYGWS